MGRQHNQTTVYSHLYLPAVLLQQSQIFFMPPLTTTMLPSGRKSNFFIHIFSPHTSINFSYIQKKAAATGIHRFVAAELSLLHVTVLDSGFATLCFHKCALMVNNFIEFAHFCQYIFLDKMLNCQLQHHFFCKFCFIYC